MHPLDVAAFEFPDRESFEASATGDRERHGNDVHGPWRTGYGFVSISDMRPQLRAMGHPPTDPAAPDGEYLGKGKPQAILLSTRVSEVVPCSADHETPAGGENLPGIVIEDNQDADCFSIRSTDAETGDCDLIHFCDWPALKAAINKHQKERGGRLNFPAPS
jgi:hypothetical protein